MTAIVHQAFPAYAGMELAEVELGLIKGHCCLFNDRGAWWFGAMADLPEAIDRFPQASTIGFYEGDLPALRALLADAA